MYLLYYPDIQIGGRIGLYNPDHAVPLENSQNLALYPVRFTLLLLLSVVLAIIHNVLFILIHPTRKAS